MEGAATGNPDEVDEFAKNAERQIFCALGEQKILAFLIKNMENLWVLQKI